MKFIHFFRHRISLFFSAFPPHLNGWVISHVLDPLNIDEPLTFVVSFDLNCGYAHQFYFNFFQSWESQPSRVEEWRVILRGKLMLDLGLRCDTLVTLGGLGLGPSWLLVSQCYNQCQGVQITDEELQTLTPYT